MNLVTKLIKNLLLALLICVGSINFAQAQEEETAEESKPALVFGGSVDTYFRRNLNAKNILDPTGVATTAPGTSFANLPGFSLGMVNLIASYDGEKTGFVADMVIGPRGADAVFGSGPSSNIVNQLYAYWKVSDAVTLTVGNFNTFLGYEVISPTGNFNYSTSYMFSYGPFSHTGLKADFDLGGGFSLMAALLNPTDATEYNPDDTYYGGAQLGYTSDAGGIWLNTLMTDGFFQIDLTTGWDVSDKTYVGFNATSASDAFLGAAAYLQVATSDALKLGVRGEYFQDKGIGIFEDYLDESIINLTLSANYTIGNLTLIPEIRMDSFSKDDVLILDNTTPLNPKLGKSLSSFVLAAVFAF